MKTSLVALSILGLVVAAVGCDGGGGGGGGGGYLTAGDYITSDGHADDGCGFGITAADLNGNTVVVSTNGTSVILDGDAYDRSGNTFGFSENLTQEQVATDCNADIANAIDGDIGQDAFDFSQTITVSNATGAGCASIPVTFPCTTDYGFHAVKQ